MSLISFLLFLTAAECLWSVLTSWSASVLISVIRLLFAVSSVVRPCWYTVRILHILHLPHGHGTRKCPVKLVTTTTCVETHLLAEPHSTLQNIWNLRSCVSWVRRGGLRGGGCASDAHPLLPRNEAAWVTPLPSSAGPRSAPGMVGDHVA